MDVEPDEPLPPEDETVSPETEAILRERMKTFEEDKKTARPASEVIGEIRKDLTSRRRT
jgi:hypothetical protein